VAFYVYVYATNGTQMTVLLGYGTQTSPGIWTMNLAVNLAPGTYSLFAEAEDSYRVFGNSGFLTLTVR
jgi:hypothetical protein